ALHPASRRRSYLRLQGLWLPPAWTSTTLTVHHHGRTHSALRALAKEKDTVYLTSDEDLGDFQSRIDCSALRFNGIFSEAEARFRVDSDETLQLALSNAK
ncbi:MAG: hypothetical protein ACRERV_10985, partial [Methylococcales bacterium]